MDGYTDNQDTTNVFNPSYVSPAGYEDNYEGLKTVDVAGTDDLSTPDQVASFANIFTNFMQSAGSLVNQFARPAGTAQSTQTHGLALKAKQVSLIFWIAIAGVVLYALFGKGRK